MDTCSNVEFQTCRATKADIKVNILYNSIYVEFKNRKMVAERGMNSLERGMRGTFWNDGKFISGLRLGLHRCIDLSKVIKMQG